MGVQPRPYCVTDEMTKSPSMIAATSPASRKRRYDDVVYSSDNKRKTIDSDDADEAQLHERVTFKRSKSGENELRVVIHSSSPRQREEEEDASPRSEGGTPKSKMSPNKARPNMSASQTITLDMLRPHFEKPLAQVAQIFSICVTLLKKICRKNGLARWPHRQIIGLRKSISSMEQAIGHFEGPRRESYAQQLEKQRNKLAALLEDPTKCNLLAIEDEYPASVTPTQEPVHAYMHHQQPARHAHPVYASYGPPPVAYERSYAPYSYPDIYAQPEYHHTRAYHHPLHQDAYPVPSYQQVPYQPAPTYVQRPPSSVSLPPLRLENRQALPSLSTVVGRRW